MFKEKNKILIVKNIENNNSNNIKEEKNLNENSIIKNNKETKPKIEPSKKIKKKKKKKRFKPFQETKKHKSWQKRKRNVCEMMVQENKIDKLLKGRLSYIEKETKN